MKKLEKDFSVIKKEEQEEQVEMRVTTIIVFILKIIFNQIMTFTLIQLK
jgi:hypothetical protein